MKHLGINHWLENGDRIVLSWLPSILGLYGTIKEKVVTRKASSAPLCNIVDVCMLRLVEAGLDPDSMLPVLD